MDEIKQLLGKIHLKLAGELLRRIENGTATPSDLNVARQLLKDNGIDSTPKANPALAVLGAMPFPAPAPRADDPGEAN